MGEKTKDLRKKIMWFFFTENGRFFSDLGGVTVYEHIFDPNSPK